MDGENKGHGHIFKRPDGMLARCGGPSMCHECANDAAIKAGLVKVEAGCGCAFCDLDLEPFEAPPQWKHGAGEFFHMTKHGPVPCAKQK